MKSSLFSSKQWQRSSSSSDLIAMGTGSTARDMVEEEEEEKKKKYRAPVRRTQSNGDEEHASSTAAPFQRSGSNPASLNHKKSNRRSKEKAPKRSLVRRMSGKSLGLNKSLSPSSSVTMKAANDMLKASVMAPVNMAAWTGQKVCHAGAMTGQAVVQAGTTVVDAGSTLIGGTIGAGSALVEGTSKAVGTSVSAVANPLVRASSGVMNYFAQSYKPKKSKWEEAIEAIDELLHPDCIAFQHMTPSQRLKLEGVRKLLLKGPTQAAKKDHVPAELMLMQSHHGGNFDSSLTFTSMGFSTVPNSVVGTSDQRRDSMHRNNVFILEEYAGVKDTTTTTTTTTTSPKSVMDHTLDSVHPDQNDGQAKHAPPPQPAATPAAAATTPPRPRSLDSPTASLTDLSDELLTDASEEGGASFATPKRSPKVDFMFVPPEFTYLERDQQMRLYETLQWDSLNNWDFNIFDLDDFTQGKSMLFVGWAILGAPYAQQAMAKELGISIEEQPKGYHFLDDLNMPPQKLYNYIRVIEQDYNSNNAYHNAIHGADVLQSLHTLIQASTEQPFMKNCPKLHLFSILLSALVHDVAHFGTTNAFHNKLQTELSVLYNDKSVMENWHISHAFSRMLDLDLTRPYNFAAKDVAFSKFQQSKNSECNLLCNAAPEQFNTIRKLMIDAILHTDMTNHFQMVNEARATLLQDDEDESDSLGQGESTWRILLFMLHLADISGQAKDDPLCRGWLERCFDEFFAQGDQEAALGLPVSPNCDRYKVVIPESQVGFIKFVVEPAFEVLGNYIPFVQESVLPIIHNNKMFYLSQQQELNTAMEKEASLRMEESRQLATLEESMRSNKSRISC